MHVRIVFDGEDAQRMTEREREMAKLHLIGALRQFDQRIKTVEIVIPFPEPIDDEPWELVPPGPW